MNTNISVRKVRSSMENYTVIVGADLNRSEVLKVFDGVRTQGVPCGDTWSHGDEVIPPQKGKTVLYFSTPRGAFKTHVVKEAVKAVLAARPHA